VKSPKTYILLLLAATTVGGVILARRQYAELIELRAGALNRDERADLQKRVWDLEKLNRELQNQVAAHREPNDGGLLAGAGEGERSPRDQSNPPERGGPGPGGRGESGLQQMTAMRELMNKPEVQAMLNLQQKAAIEARYSALFKNLNLPPEQIEKLKTLLAERGTTMQDLMTVAREQGLNPRENQEAYRKLVADTQNEINKGIKAVIGDQGFAQLTTYEQTLPQRNLVNELQQRLSYTSTPLTSTQAEQMVQILAANAPQRQANAATVGSTTHQTSGGPPPGGGRGGSGGPGVPRGADFGSIIGALGGGPGMGMLAGALDGAGRGSSSAPVTAAAVTQSQTVLAPPQVAALQQIQQQQQSQQQLQKLVHETLVANQPTNTKGSGKSGAATGGVTSGTGGGNPAPKRGGGGD
jgi:hypothetical protein